MPKKIWGVIMKAFCFILFTVVIQNQSLKAQSFDGTDFWIGYLATNADPTLQFQLNIISDTAATVTVSIPQAATPYSVTFQLVPNVLFTHVVPTNLASNNGFSHEIRNTGIHVTSDADIILYPGNNQDYSSDAATAIPTSALGKNYDVIAYSALTLTRSSTFSITATENNTSIQITYNGWTENTAGTNIYNAGDSHTITLDEGEVYTVIAYDAIPLLPPENPNSISSDLTGTKIVADKPVAVFGGNVCAYAGECPFCDHLFEQIRPLKSWGYRYNIVPTYKLPVVSSDIIRTYSTEPATTVNMSGALPVNLGQQEYNQFEIASPVFVESNNPIHTSLYLKGSTCNTPAGEIDPLMMDIVPENQYASEFLFGTSSYTRYTRHYATIVVEQGEEASLRLNGVPVPFIAPGPVNIPGSTYSGSYVQLNGGTSYKLESITGAKMSVYVYGYGTEEAYGYVAGGKITDLCYVQTEDTTVCYGDSALIHGLNINILTGEEVANNNILWFNDETGGSPVYSGKNVMTAPITDTTILWAQVDNETCLNERYQITINALPEVTASIAQDEIICNGDTVSLEFTLSGYSNSFDVVYTNGASNFNLNNVGTGITDPQAPTATTTYTILTVVDDSIPMCQVNILEPDVVITVSQTPQVLNFVRTCDPTETNFIIEFDLNLGDIATYTVDGLTGSFDPAGTHFTSTPLANGSSYSFMVYDGQACDTVFISGVYVCNCLSVPGTMANTTTVETFCNGTAATVVHNGDHLLQPEDKLVFYLHTGSGAFLGTVIDSSLTPSFNFGPGMNFGTTYYISPAVADSTASGFIDRMDLCFNIEIGTPIVFYSVPTGSISGTTDICLGDSTALLFTLSGNGPFNVEYTDGSSVFTLNNINNGHNAYVSPSIDTDYDLVSVYSTNGSNCAGILSGQASITVNPLPDFTLSGAIAICEGTSTDVPLQLTGTGPFNITYTSNSANNSVNNVNSGDVLTLSPLSDVVLTPTSILDQANGCTGTVNGTYNITLNDIPIVQSVEEICNNDDTYNVTFQINGGSGNYTVAGGPGTITGNTFESDPIPSNTSYSFLVFDNNQCDTIEINGVYDCCPTEAGNMNTNPTYEACVGQSVTVSHDGNQLLMPGDILQYVVYTNAGDPLNSTIFWSNIPTITYNPAIMQPGVIYYLKAAAGPNNQGKVDYSSPCVDFSTNELTILFHERPVITITGDSTVCLGQTANIHFEITGGTGPWSFDYNNQGVVVPDMANGTTKTVQVTPLSPQSSFFPVMVSDQTTGCSGTATGTVIITTEDPVSEFKIVGGVTSDGVTVADLSIGTGDIEWIMPVDIHVFGDSLLEFKFDNLTEGSYEACLIVNAIYSPNCQDTSCQLITLPSSFNIFVPNSFTPNSNEFNDEFRAVVGGGAIETFNMQIFNRWGELVFESKNMDIGWNGGLHNQGPTLPDGSYAYKVSVKRYDSPKTEVVTGQVTLLK